MIGSARKLLVVVLLCHLSALSGAQVTFRADTNLCETAPWKLVWYDEFDGAALDRRKWYTYSDDGNWGPAGVYDSGRSLASRVSSSKVIYYDANVMVNGGACTLNCRYEPSTFYGYRGDSYGSASMHFTSGMLLARRGNMPMYFNRGRFDMRARLPYRSGAWATFWLYGGGQDANPNADPPTPPRTGCEIDMVEYNPCIGGSGFGTHGVHEMDDLPWNMHGQRRGLMHNEDHSIGGRMTYKSLSDWHLYSTIWDENFVQFYVDGILRHEEARYKNGRRSARCQPDPSMVYYNDPDQVFPRPDEFMKMLVTHDLTNNIYSRNIAGICTPIPGWMKSRDKVDEEFGEAGFELDYIRVYQRENRIQKGLTNLCPELSVRKISTDSLASTYIYEISGGAFTSAKWLFDAQKVNVVDSTDHSLKVTIANVALLKRSTVVSVRITNLVAGCETSVLSLPNTR